MSTDTPPRKTWTADEILAIQRPHVDQGLEVELLGPGIVQRAKRSLEAALADRETFAAADVAALPIHPFQIIRVLLTALSERELLVWTASMVGAVWNRYVKPHTYTDQRAPEVALALQEYAEGRLSAQELRAVTDAQLVSRDPEDPHAYRVLHTARTAVYATLQQGAQAGAHATTVAAIVSAGTGLEGPAVWEATSLEAGRVVGALVHLVNQKGGDGGTGG